MASRGKGSVAGFILGGFARALFLVLWGVLGLFPSAYAEEPAQTIRLKYVDHGFRLGIPGDEQSREVRFKKEPSFSGSSVVRTALVFGEKPEDYVGVAWDRAKHRLYVDANRNLDLTDDKPEFYQTGGLDEFCDVKNVRVTVSGRSYCLDVTLLAFGDYIDCNGAVRSGWEGQGTLNGEPWTFAVADNLDGVVGKDDSLVLYKDKGYRLDEGVRFFLYGVDAAPKLSVNGRTYAFQYAFEGNELVVTFREVPAPTGEVKISGRFIERLVLYGEAPAVLDAPQGTVSVPVAAYANAEVNLLDPKTGVCYQSLTGSKTMVTADKPVTLKWGGPLNNTVTPTRRGASFTLDYSAVGIGREAYRRIDESDEALARREEKPPKLTILCNGQKIASANFEYG